MTQKYEVGCIYNTPKGKIKILDRTKKIRTSEGRTIHPRATIKFIETGSVLNVQVSNIRQGKIKDYRKKTVYGVGYIGSDITIPMRNSNSIIRRIYDLWANMLKRCYGDYKGKYINCKVDVRWHSFTSFLNTIDRVPNYNEWVKDSLMCLDKDIKHTGNKLYSLDTCIFTTIKENTRDASNRRWGNK